MRGIIQGHDDSAAISRRLTAMTETAAGPRTPVEVFIETGQKRVFACALDWPGWTRSGRSEELALAALTDYLPRYAPVIRRAGLPPADLAVAERGTGTAGSTDFAVPGMVAQRDLRPLVAGDGERLAACQLPPDQAPSDQAPAGQAPAGQAGPQQTGSATPSKAADRPVRYAARRIGWHVLDHAWEIEDKSE
jgi:hypothetical protein